MKRKPARNNTEPTQPLPDEPVLWARLYPAKFAIEAFQMDDAAFGARMKRILKALSAGRRGVDTLADEMLEDVRKLPEAVRMPVDMSYRRPGGPHRFGDPGNAVWDRLPGKGYYFGLSRPYVYQLMKAGQIKTALLKHPGRCRGIRLVWRPSVLEYIERHRVEGI